MSDSTINHQRAAGNESSRPVPEFSVEDLTKHYGPVKALQDVTLSFKRGEVHALLGQNGSGKSTLVKLLSGTVAPTSGIILRDGDELTLHSVEAAKQAGIVTVFQELSVLPSLTVAENVLIGRYKYSPLGTIRRRDLHRRAQAVLDQFKIRLPLEAPCRTLSLLELQLVEVARALSCEPSLLILDEATSALDQPDAENLLRISRELAAAGHAVLFVSHRMDEVFSVADRVSVLTDGKLVHSGPAVDATREELLVKLAGKALRPLERAARSSHEHSDKTLLRAELPGFGQDGGPLNINIQAGEIIGLAGLQGHGQKDVLRRLAGDVADRGMWVEVEGRRINRPSPHRMIKAHVAYVPEDRNAEGLLLGHSVRTNATLSSLDRVAPGGILRRSREDAVARRVIDRLSVRAESPLAPMESLSGGNQQKVLIGRALEVEPNVVLLDDPTRGIDAGAKADIYQTLQALATEGRTIMLNSTELPELAALCDRVLVFHDHRLAAELTGDDVNESSILAHMVGAAA